MKTPVSYPTIIDNEWHIVRYYLTKTGWRCDTMKRVRWMVSIKDVACSGESIVPSLGFAAAKQQEYWLHIRDTGQDPLNFCLTRHKIYKLRKYQIAIRPTIGGPIWCGWKPDKGAWDFKKHLGRDDKPPPCVWKALMFCFSDSVYRQARFSNRPIDYYGAPIPWENYLTYLKDGVFPGVRLGRKGKFITIRTSFHVYVPRSQSAIERDNRKYAAKRILR